MAVGNVTNSNSSAVYNNTTTAKTNTTQKTQETKDKSSTTGVYSPDAATIQKLWDETDSATSALRNLVNSLLGNNKTGEGIGQTFWAKKADPSAYNLNVDSQTQADAAAMISEDGYYGVKQTTERIMSFAKALAGGNVDEKAIENLRDGTKKGFDDVAKLFGGFNKLPQVTKDTYNAVMKSFDDWKSSLTTAVK